LGKPAVTWGSRLVILALVGGVPLGISLLLPSRSGTMLWWAAVSLILTIGVLLAALLRDNLGTGGLLILAAGLVPILANRLAAKWNAVE
jgi:hypothetical protein